MSVATKPYLATFEEAQAAYRDEDTLALDLETGGLSAWRDPIHVIALYGPKSGTPAVLHYPAGTGVPRNVLAWLASFPELVTHNGAQFDLHFLHNAGMGDGVYRPRWYDTMVGEMSVLQVDRRNSRVNLGDTANRRLGVKLDKKIDHEGWGAPELSEDHLTYVLGDIGHLIDLRDSQFARAAEIDGYIKLGEDRSTAACIDFEMRLTRPMFRMKQRGLPISLERVNAFLDSQEETLAEAKATLSEILGPINFNSSVQLMKALSMRFNSCPLPEDKRLHARLTFPNTQADTLGELSHWPGEVGMIARALLEYRHVAKRKGMYGPEWQAAKAEWHGDHHRLHGNIWQNGTNTGRMSSSDPNLQQIPKDMRFCFGGRPGYVLGKTDYSAIEVRVAAVMAPDDKMIAAFGAGRDIHKVVASAGFGVEYDEVTKEQRQIAKAMSFTLLFGGSVERFRDYAAHNGSPIDAAAANDAFTRFMERFSGIDGFRSWAAAKVAKYERSGKPLPIVYPSGLKRNLVDAELRPTVLLNNLVQGTAGVGLKAALIKMEEAGIADHLCAVVHDEIVYEATPDEMPELQAEVERCMIDGMHWALRHHDPIPIAVESTYGETWAGDPGNVHAAEW
jgi:DNA polymerase I-like protein with 3'-5' exonuclease and polymerase domains